MSARSTHCQLPPALLPLPFWALLGIRIPKTDSEIHERRVRPQGKERKKELIMSPVTVVAISGLVLGDVTFFTPFAGGSTPSYKQLMSQRPRVILNWVQSHFSANLQGKCKFQRAALVKRVCASTAFPALQVIRITSCLVGPELQDLSLC